MKTIIIAVVIIIAFTGCDKDILSTSKETNLTLPPATQSGQNTFGCIVNGVNWVSQDKDCSAWCNGPFRMVYDGAWGGTLTLNCIRLNSSKAINDRIIISFDSTNYHSTHTYTGPTDMVFYYESNKYSGSCATISSHDVGVTSSGTVNITKYDLSAGIISGTFSFVLTKSGCETITVTDGRFDKQL